VLTVVTPHLSLILYLPVADSYPCLSRLQNDLTYFRIATKKFEIMVAPRFGNVKYTAAGAQKEKGYTLFVLQRKPGQTA
jgi:hypothetical protein